MDWSNSNTKWSAQKVDVASSSGSAKRISEIIYNAAQHLSPARPVLAKSTQRHMQPRASPGSKQHLMATNGFLKCLSMHMANGGIDLSLDGTQQLSNSTSRTLLPIYSASTPDWNS